MMRFIYASLLLLHLSRVKWVDCHSIAELSLIQFPNRTVIVNSGETRSFTCGTSRMDPLPLVAWYKASTLGRIMVRLTAWTSQNSTFSLESTTTNDSSLYVCHIDTSTALRSLHAFSFKLVVQASGSKQANSSTPSQGNASPGDQQDTSPTENPNTNEGSETEARKDDTVDIGRLEQNQSQNELDSTTTSLLYVIAVLQVIGLIVIVLMIISYYNHRRRALINKYGQLLKSESPDLEGGITQVTTATSTPLPQRPSDRTFQQRSKSMKPLRRANEVELELKSLTQKKKKSADNGKTDGKLQKRAKSKTIVEKRPSNEEEPDRSPSIVPLVRNPSTRTGGRYGKHTPLDRLLSEDSGDVTWDTYNSLMEESLTNAMFEKEKRPKRRKKKEKVKQPKLSEIDPYVREDDDYWREMGARSSTPNQTIMKRSKSTLDHPSSPRKANVPSVVFEEAPKEQHSKKRHSLDDGVFWPHETAPDSLQWPTGKKQGKPKLLMLHPGLKDDEQAFTPNLVRRLKTLYDQGFSIQIT